LALAEEETQVYVSRPTSAREDCRWFITSLVIGKDLTSCNLLDTPELTKDERPAGLRQGGREPILCPALAILMCVTASTPNGRERFAVLLLVQSFVVTRTPHLQVFSSAIMGLRPMRWRRRHRSLCPAAPAQLPAHGPRYRRACVVQRVAK
jgi:hypothetical protein